MSNEIRKARLRGEGKCQVISIATRKAIEPLPEPPRRPKEGLGAVRD